MNLEKAYKKAYPDGTLINGEFKFKLGHELSIAPNIPLPLAIDHYWSVEGVKLVDEPCPFCGGEDITTNTYLTRTVGGIAQVDKASCGCASCGVYAVEKTLDEAKESWNTRVQ